MINRRSDTWKGLCVEPGGETGSCNRRSLWQRPRTPNQSGVNETDRDPQEVTRVHTQRSAQILRLQPAQEEEAAEERSGKRSRTPSPAAFHFISLLTGIISMFVSQ